MRHSYDLPLLLVLHAAAAPLRGGSLPSKGDGVPLCSHTYYVSVCNLAARTYRHNYRTADAISLLSMQIDMVADRTHAAKAAAKQLISRSGNPDRKDALQLCNERFDEALRGLEAARSAIAARDAGTAGSMLAGLATAFSTCDSGFTEIEMENPLAEQDNLLLQAVDNALAIAQEVLK